MNDFAKNALADAQKGAATYKKAKAKRDKVKGALDDISKLHNTAQHLLEYNTSSSSFLLKTAYEGVQRLATKYGSGAPILTVFFRYHQPHMDLLASVLQAKNEANFAIKWQGTCEKKSKMIQGTVDKLVEKNGFAGAMVNSNGKLSSNLPRDFREYCELDAFDKTTPEKEALEMSQSRPSQGWADYERERLGNVILANAHDMACAFLMVANETDKFTKSMIEANAHFRKLKKGKTDVDAAFGGMAERAMQLRALANGATQEGNQGFEEVQLFTSGNAVATPSFQRTGQAYRKMRQLSEKWQRWAKLVADDSHLNSY